MMSRFLNTIKAIVRHFLCLLFMGCAVASDINLQKGEMFKLQPNDNANEPAKKVAIEWITAKWDKLYPAIYSEIIRQSELRNHDINNSKKTQLNEVMLLVGGVGKAWNGEWAIAVTGEDTAYRSSFCYYVQMNKERVSMSAVAGIGFNYGAVPLEKIKGKRATVRDLNLKNHSVSKFTENEKALLSGVWSLNKANAADALEKCFGLKTDLDENEFGDSIYLVVSGDSTCKLILPFNGIRQKAWTGALYGFTLDGWPKSKFVGIAANAPDMKTAKSHELNFITLTSERRLTIRRNEITMEFVRPVEEPAFEYSELNDVLRNQSVGSMK